MADTMIKAKLDLIAAKGKVASEKYGYNQYWPGELESDLGEIAKLVDEILTQIGRRGW